MLKVIELRIYFLKNRYAEAEATLLENNQSSNNLDDIIEEFGDQASFALALLGKIAAKTERKARAMDVWKRALKLNPFLWSNFESLCKIGDKPNPQNIFQINNMENLSMCHGSSINNIESVIITNNTPNQDNQEAYITTPQQILTNFNPNMNANTKQMCTPEESPLAFPLCMSGIRPIPASRCKVMRVRLESCSSVSFYTFHIFI